MGSESFGQIAAWLLIAAVIVVFVVAVIDEKEDSNPKDMWGRRKKASVDRTVEKKSPGKEQTHSHASKDEMAQTNAIASQNKTLIPPPGEIRIEGVAPRNTGPRR